MGGAQSAHDLGFLRFEFIQGFVPLDSRKEPDWEKLKTEVIVFHSGKYVQGWFQGFRGAILSVSKVQTTYRENSDQLIPFYPQFAHLGRFAQMLVVQLSGSLR